MFAHVKKCHHTFTSRQRTRTKKATAQHSVSPSVHMKKENSPPVKPNEITFGIGPFIPNEVFIWGKFFFLHFPVLDI